MRAVILNSAARGVGEIITKPGILAHWTIQKGCLDSFLSAPELRIYIDQGVPVLVHCEDDRDARRLQQLLAEGKVPACAA